MCWGSGPHVHADVLLKHHGISELLLADGAGVLHAQAAWRGARRCVFQVPLVVKARPQILHLKGRSPRVVPVVPSSGRSMAAQHAVAGDALVGVCHLLVYVLHQLLQLGGFGRLHRVEQPSEGTWPSRLGPAGDRAAEAWGCAAVRQGRSAVETCPAVAGGPLPWRLCRAGSRKKPAVLGREDPRAPAVGIPQPPGPPASELEGGPGDKEGHSLDAGEGRCGERLAGVRLGEST